MSLDNLERQGVRVYIRLQERLDDARVQWLVSGVSFVVLVVALLAQTRVAVRLADFPVFYGAALSARSGGNPLAPAAAWITTYQVGQPLNGSLFVYTPAAALLFVPLTILPIGSALHVWDVANVLFVVGAVAALIRVSGHRLTPAFVLVPAALAALLDPIRLDLYLGATDIFLLFLVCMALWAAATGRGVLAGMLLAVACAIKPAVLLFVLYLIWKRANKTAISAIGGFAVLLVIPLLWLGLNGLHDQLMIWQFWSATYAPFAKNLAPRGVLARALSPNPVVPPLISASGLVAPLSLIVSATIILLALVVLPRGTLRPGFNVLVEAGLVATVALLVSPLTEDTYLTLLVIPFVGAWCRASRADWRLPRTRLYLIGLCAVWLLLCIPDRQVKLWWGRLMPGTSSLVMTLVVVSVQLALLLVVFTLQLVVMWDPRHIQSLRHDLAGLLHRRSRAL
jgi:hypothetical protein